MGREKVELFMDGDSWCAVFPDFVNLQESPAGFGHTRGQAVDALFETKPEPESEASRED